MTRGKLSFGAMVGRSACLAAFFTTLGFVGLRPSSVAFWAAALAGLVLVRCYTKTEVDLHRQSLGLGPKYVGRREGLR